MTGGDGLAGSARLALAAWLVVLTATCGPAPAGAPAPPTASYTYASDSTSPAPATTSSPNVGVRFGPLTIGSIGFAEAPAIDAPTGFRSIRVSLLMRNATATPIEFTYRSSYVSLWSKPPEMSFETLLMRLSVTSTEGYRYLLGDRLDPTSSLPVWLPPSYGGRLDFAAQVAVTAHAPFAAAIIPMDGPGAPVAIPQAPLGSAFLPTTLPAAAVALEGVNYMAFADRTTPPNDSAFNAPVTAAPGRSWMRVVVTAANSGGYQTSGSAQPEILSQAGYVHFFEWNGPVGGRVGFGFGACCSTAPGQTKTWAYYFALGPDEIPVAIVLAVAGSQQISFGAWPVR